MLHRFLVAGSLLIACLASHAPLAHAQGFVGGAITINASGAATPYPSDLLVAGVVEPVSGLRVTLANLSHSWPADVDILLVGPQGQNVILMSDAGSSVAINNVTFVFDDAADAALTTGGPLVSGTYRPTNLAGTGSDLFPAPAPALSGATTLSTFDGTNANGTWSLYVLDDSAGDGGTIGSWSLTFAPEPGADGSLAAVLALLAVAAQGKRASA
jgi:hypothetical protein